MLARCRSEIPLVPGVFDYALSSGPRRYPLFSFCPIKSLLFRQSILSSTHPIGKLVAQQYPIDMPSRVVKSKDEGGNISSGKNIIFFHPDLGIGGAERLVIDAAVGLQNLGHKVVVFTSHCDPSHCFDEARDGIYHFVYHLDFLQLKAF